MTKVKVTITGTMEISDDDVKILKNVNPAEVAQTLIMNSSDLEAKVHRVKENFLP